MHETEVGTPQGERDHLHGAPRLKKGSPHQEPDSIRRRCDEVTGSYLHGPRDCTPQKPQSFLKKPSQGTAGNPNYGYDAEQTYRMEEMSPGELTMFMLHTLLASGEDRLDGIWKAQATLLVDTDGGTPGYMYCRWAMQLTFAAGRCIGKLTSTKEQKEQKEQQEGSVPSSAARGRGRGSTSPHQAV